MQSKESTQKCDLEDQFFTVFEVATSGENRKSGKRVNIDLKNKTETKKNKNKKT